jgi:3-methyl-2-oxobutanoate hydroxymethyltransferase
MRNTISHFQKMKKHGEKIPMLTAYDYPTAQIMDRADIPVLLVGDSLGMVVLGYESTVPVTLEEMIHHGKAVVRGSEKALVIVDMPFLSFQISPEEAVRNAGKIMKETHCQAVKLEGGQQMAETVKRIVSCGIPVAGHIGLTPQSVNQLGGYKVVGKSLAGAHRLVNDALALQEAGAFMIILETVPAKLAALISQKLSIPTIGIGSGVDCDGQVLVMHDIFGTFEGFVPKHAKQYAPLGEDMKKAFVRYSEEVEKSEFPTAAESYSISDKVMDELKNLLEGK